MVGDGLLSAAVAGNIFASPNTNQILEAIKQVDNDKGVSCCENSKWAGGQRQSG
jgi:dihydroxyacetone kinase